MAKLLEYQGKQWLRKAGLSVPEGYDASSESGAYEIAKRIGCAVAVKGQVLTGGRGKAGIVKIVDGPDEARAAAAEILQKTVNGLPVRQVLIEEKLNIEKEFYCSIVIDGAQDMRAPVMMFSAEGGMDIEQVPEELIFKKRIDPLFGMRIYEAIGLCRMAGVEQRYINGLAAALTGLAGAFKTYECSTLEINPLVVTSDGRFFCADCKMDIDNGAITRHPEFGVKIARDFPGEPTELDYIGWGIEESDSRGTGFLMGMGYDEKSPGYIGYHPIGGGSAMMGLDALNHFGLRPANYADTSGNPVGAKIYRVAKSILCQPNIDGYLLGGFMMANQEQWHHAHAIVKALREILPEQKPGQPCVLLLCGNREDESLEILRTGLFDLMTEDGPGRRIEIYGKEYVTDTKFIGQRLQLLAKEYRAEKEQRGEGLQDA